MGMIIDEFVYIVQTECSKGVVREKILWYVCIPIDPNYMSSTQNRIDTYYQGDATSSLINVRVHPPHPSIRTWLLTECLEPVNVCARIELSIIPK